MSTLYFSIEDDVDNKTFFTDSIEEQTFLYNLFLFTTNRNCRRGVVRRINLKIKNNIYVTDLFLDNSNGEDLMLNNLKEIIPNFQEHKYSKMLLSIWSKKYNEKIKRNGIDKICVFSVYIDTIFEFNMVLESLITEVNYKGEIRLY